MASPTLVAALVTILPAAAAMWYLLRRYEDYFDDARVFFALTVGLFGGLAAAALEFIVFRFGDQDFRLAAGSGTAFIFFVVGYAFFETGIKVMAMGMGRFRGRKDTPYYGASLGLGMGALSAMIIVANADRVAKDIGNEYTIASYLAMAAVPIGAIFVHGAVGAWVGQGSADNKLTRGWLIGTLLQAPVLGALWLLWPSLGQGNVILLMPALFAPAYGIALLAITQKRLLDQIVPKEIRDQVRRDRRRAARQAAGAAPLAATDSEE